MTFTTIFLQHEICYLILFIDNNCEETIRFYFEEINKENMCKGNLGIIQPEKLLKMLLSILLFS